MATARNTGLRLWSLLLACSALTGYLEWGGGNSTFIAVAEAGVVSTLLSGSASAVRPFTIIPLAGQLVLLANACLQRPRILIFWLGVVAQGMLLLFMLFVGIISRKACIIASVLPFMLSATCACWWLHSRRASN